MVGFRFVVAMFLLSGFSLVGAQVHHVVSGDRGWDLDSRVGLWSSGRVFSVGDKLWFTYSAAQEGIVELRTRQEYESCDITNPIRMYTEGINSLTLEEQGLRYFVSSKSENCKNGLKLHVDVQPRSSSPWEIKGMATTEESAIALAESPSSPSSSPHLAMNLGTLVLLVFASLLGFNYAFKIE